MSITPTVVVPSTPPRTPSTPAHCQRLACGPINPQNTAKNVVEIANRYFLNDRAAAEALVAAVREKQYSLKPKQSQFHKATSETFPYTIMIMKQCFVVFEGLLGQGATSGVYEGRLFSQWSFETDGLEFSPDYSQLVAVKISNSIPFSPQKKLLSVVDKNGSQSFDVTLFSTHNLDGNFASINRKMAGDLESINYQALANPVQFAFKGVVALLEGLHALHKENLVHRDIKPANILYSNEGMRWTDFVTLKKYTGERHNIEGTPTYFDMPLPDQFCLSGVQDSLSDLYALGKVIERKILGRLLHQAGGIPLSALQIFVAREVPVSFEELPSYDAKFRGRSYTSLKERVVGIFETVQEREYAMNSLIEESRFNNKNALLALSGIAFAFQNEEREERPSAAKVLEYIGQLRRSGIEV